jgi:hypothetical protein
VEIESADRRQTTTRDVRVRRTEPQEFGHWFHGCTFCEPLSDEDLAAFV